MMAHEGPSQRREQRQRPPQQEDASWSRQGNGGGGAAAGGGGGPPRGRLQHRHSNHGQQGRGGSDPRSGASASQNQVQRQQLNAGSSNNRDTGTARRHSLFRQQQQQQQQQSSINRLAQTWQSLEDDEELHDLKVASLVGDDAGRYVETNRVVLAKRSLVFRKMLYGNFRESKSDMIHLEYPLKVIQVVIRYIYTNTLVLGMNSGGLGSSRATDISNSGEKKTTGGNDNGAPLDGRDEGGPTDGEGPEDGVGESNLAMEGVAMEDAANNGGRETSRRRSAIDDGRGGLTALDHVGDDEEEDEEHRCMIIIEEARFLVQVAICAEYLELAHLGELVYDSLMMDLLDIYPHLVACAVVDETLDAAAASSYDGHRSHVRRMHDMALRVIQGQPQFCLLGVPDPSTHVDEFEEAIGRQAAAEAAAMIGGPGGPDMTGRAATEGEAEESIFFNRNNLNQGGVVSGGGSVSSVGGRYSSYAEAAAETGAEVDGDASRGAGAGSSNSAAGANDDSNSNTGDRESGDATISSDVVAAAATASSGAGLRGSFDGIGTSSNPLAGAVGCGVLLLRAEALSKVIAMQPMNCDEIVLFRAIKLWYDFHQQEEEEEEEERRNAQVGEEQQRSNNKESSSEEACGSSDGDGKAKSDQESNSDQQQAMGAAGAKAPGTSSIKGKLAMIMSPSSSRKRLMKHALSYDSGRSFQGGFGPASTGANTDDGWNDGSTAIAQKIVHTSIALKRIKPSHLRDEVIPSRLANLQDLNDALLHQALLAEECQMIDVRRLPVWSSSGTEIVTASSQSGSSAYLKCPPMTEDGRLGLYRALQQQQSFLSSSEDRGSDGMMMVGAGDGAMSIGGDICPCVYRWSVEVLKSDGKILMGIFGGPDPLNPTFKAHVKGDGRRFKFNQREAPTIQEVEACQYLKFSAGSVIYFTLDFDQHDICLTAKVIHQPTEMVCEEEILFSHIRDEFSPNEEIILHPGVYCRSPCSIRLTSFH